MYRFQSFRSMQIPGTYSWSIYFIVCLCVETRNARETDYPRLKQNRNPFSTARARYVFGGNTWNWCVVRNPFRVGTQSVSLTGQPVVQFVVIHVCSLHRGIRQRIFHFHALMKLRRTAWMGSSEPISACYLDFKIRLLTPIETFCYLFPVNSGRPKQYLNNSPLG